MCTSDKWSGREWVINDAVGDALAKVLLAPRGTTRFHLQPIWDQGRIACFRVDYHEGEMTSCWSPPVHLFPRGSQCVELPPPGDLPPLPLPAWVAAPPHGEPPFRAVYAQAAKVILDKCGQHLVPERLEADIHVDGNPETVTLYQLPPGVLADKTFLVIQVTAELQVRESGIAHGNS